MDSSMAQWYHASEGQHSHSILVSQLAIGSRSVNEELNQLLDSLWGLSLSSSSSWLLANIVSYGGPGWKPSCI
jgi:hypothetical protein